jgi:hypothetical protein
VAQPGEARPAKLERSESEDGLPGAGTLTPSQQNNGSLPPFDFNALSHCVRGFAVKPA